MDQFVALYRESKATVFTFKMGIPVLSKKKEYFDVLYVTVKCEAFWQKVVGRAVYFDMNTLYIQQ